MNIVHLQISGGIGGIETLCKDINKISNNNNIMYYLFEGGQICDEIKATGTTVVENNLKHSDYIKGAKNLVKYCKDNNVDVVISHSGAPICRYFLWYCKRHIKNIKCLLYFHSNASISTYESGAKQKLNSYLIKKAYQTADNGIAISNTVKDSFTKMYQLNPNKMKVVYNGIELNKFYHQQDKNDVFTIISVGRLIEQKGIHTLIMAAALLDFDFKLNIIGKYNDEKYNDYLKNLIFHNNLQDKVFLQGAKRNVNEWLSKSDLYVHSAICDEGFGITIVEAMASSLPCVAINKGAISELIRDNYNGFLVNSTDEKDLAKTITKFYNLYIQNKTDEMSINAKNSAQKYSIQNTVNRLEKLYK